MSVHGNANIIRESVGNVYRRQYFITQDDTSETESTNLTQSRAFAVKPPDRDYRTTAREEFPTIVLKRYSIRKQIQRGHFFQRNIKKRRFAFPAEDIHRVIIEDHPSTLHRHLRSATDKPLPNHRYLRRVVAVRH